jgi:hypothetical protein
MTVVPASFQLAGWIPAYWRGAVGGDDMLSILDPPAVNALADLRDRTTAVTAYCPALGVGVLPGPRRCTEAAVAAGEAVVLHGRDRSQSHLLVPLARGWELLECDTPRPVDLDVRQAATEMGQAVVVAEHEVRARRLQFQAQSPAAAVRALPPDADPQSKGLLVRAVRIWTAVDALDPVQRTPELQEVLRAAARATLAAYAGVHVAAAERQPRHARRSV